MPTIDEMEAFINWDGIDPAAMPGARHPNDLDLALENVDDDDFAAWALQHYEHSNPLGIGETTDAIPSLVPPPGDPIVAFEDSFDMPSFPCNHCQTNGYQCKRIREGSYKGYCTGCVALNRVCSFGLLDQPTLPRNPGSTTSIEEQDQPSTAAPVTPATKVNGRFSRESIKVLKNWLSTHHKHPYPNDEEKEMLQKQTGLNKTQITGWLANARRRRGKAMGAPRSISPGVRSLSNNMDIPQRRPQLELMNPLQRWQVSPPEHEPASVTAIARAVTASATTLSSGSPHSNNFNFTDDGSNRSLCAASSASSFNTSISSGVSFASAYSYGTHDSIGSYGSSMNRGRRRRRRKAAPVSSENNKNSLSAPLKTFQCTFCTETFRTKHDWQRHEKSLHLSLERWVCAPEGPRASNPENGQVSCVFCGEANPDEAHIESHNYSICQEKTQEERTFYRKDHLRQHLKLVHNVKLVNWSMEQWTATTPEIRSRCGFCGIVMDTWSIRVDHLAEHFKTGQTMADWKGDWGFDTPILEMIENAIPPFLIHDERNSPCPYTATQAPPETARNAYELIKSELMYYLANERDIKGRVPTDEELQIEACRIIYAAEVQSNQSISAIPSWLRDLLLSSEPLALQARMAPIRSANESRQSVLRINGKGNIFEDDPMERELHEYVKARRLLGLTAMDGELQYEACNIIGRMEESSSHPSEDVANFLLRLIYGSASWLAEFRQRAVLPRSEDVCDEARRSTDPSKIDSTIHNYSRLERELAEFLHMQRSMGIEPTDMDLQNKARIIIYECDDSWNQTAADNTDWLTAFKQRHVSPEASAVALATFEPLTISSVSQNRFTPLMDMTTWMSTSCFGGPRNPSLGSIGTPTFDTAAGIDGHIGKTNNAVKIGPYFFNDANCYRRLARELGAYVASVKSPNSPDCHIPSDKELQRQARWILYQDDDPWNQTAADNAEWLRRFKRDVGILTHSSLPGLPECTQWSAAQGGSGFEPPYLFPNPNAQVTTVETDIPIKMKEAKRIFVAERQTANKYVRGFKTRWQRPAVVFCSRELEKGLVEFVTGCVMGTGDEGGGGGGTRGMMFPSDEAIRAKAREIQKMSTTSADDAVLLEKFKNMMREKLGLLTSTSASASSLGSTPNFSGMGGGGGGRGLMQSSSSVDTSAVPSPVTAAGFTTTGTTTSPDLSMGMDMDMGFGFGTSMPDMNSSMSNLGMTNLTDWSSTGLSMGLGTSMAAASCTNMGLDMAMNMGMNPDMTNTSMNMNMSTSMPTASHMGLLGAAGGAPGGGGGQDMMMMFTENEMDDLLQESSFGFSSNDDDLAVMGGIGQL
ncbi:hypothetical protein QBC32DRAFT_157034 [Pseudoneurospora amorphoporcata]|uniref:Uncharacterized protein n=1 Tax=Pseudoneurospora amorphoporcata TaxID=241081 RepID=A0AAN6SK13_9PEZI|nr:hypothetical protein QBC32DRAFT_157034 [Pseudoneurospora amorphoporcata]